MMAVLTPIYLGAWNEAIHGAAHSGEASGLGGRTDRCGQGGASVDDLLALELAEYREQFGLN